MGSDNNIKKFFNLLFPEIAKGAFIEIRYKKPGITGLAQRWAEGVSELVQNLAAQSGKIKEWEMWFGVCPRTGQDGSKKAVKRVHTLWADVDFKDFQKESLENALGALDHQPHIRINSGHGMHLYWLLN